MLYRLQQLVSILSKANSIHGRLTTVAYALYLAYGATSYVYRRYERCQRKIRHKDRHLQLRYIKEELKDEMQGVYALARSRMRTRIESARVCYQTSRQLWASWRRSRKKRLMREQQLAQARAERGWEEGGEWVLL
ncbi:unnamed protein product [Vitrella brassicaformis CCMP3155]|uniref:Uncharacterized protein n=2 Tax=Vitrella brassicaformis TaxID=1169539 RepID=A0A0G4F371_VITBC|nr:unnamed protein product [Vitrella brassicaformis CCMP3155]|mmetsp:Transcript_22074/g.54231  ORF Transcript_22074/g.54231 Transcript_22074/m.54231 type:complete len:135 (+) Transcript_22074:297-701(+)|eukprot:CEM06353.1 unnamed protein product [Vitrella brassicaformis CCMP3155]